MVGEMRQREVLSVKWVIVSADGKRLATEYHYTTKEAARHAMLDWVRGSVRLWRITRYRLAPLIELSEWKRTEVSDFTVSKNELTGARVYPWGKWIVWNHSNGNDTLFQGKGGLTEAVAALKLLGYKPGSKRPG